MIDLSSVCQHPALKVLRSPLSQKLDVFRLLFTPQWWSFGIWARSDIVMHVMMFSNFAAFTNRNPYLHILLYWSFVSHYRIFRRYYSGISDFKVPKTAFCVVYVEACKLLLFLQNLCIWTRPIHPPYWPSCESAEPTHWRNNVHKVFRYMQRSRSHKMSKNDENEINN